MAIRLEYGPDPATLGELVYQGGRAQQLAENLLRERARSDQQKQQNFGNLLSTAQAMQSFREAAANQKLAQEQLELRRQAQQSDQQLAERRLDQADEQFQGLYAPGGLRDEFEQRQVMRREKVAMIEDAIKQPNLSPQMKLQYRSAINDYYATLQDSSLSEEEKEMALQQVDERLASMQVAEPETMQDMFAKDSFMYPTEFGDIPMVKDAQGNWRVPTGMDGIIKAQIDAKMKQQEQTGFQIDPKDVRTVYKEVKTDLESDWNNATQAREDIDYLRAEAHKLNLQAQGGDDQTKAASESRLNQIQREIERNNRIIQQAVQPTPENIQREMIQRIQTQQAVMGSLLGNGAVAPSGVGQAVMSQPANAAGPMPSNAPMTPPMQPRAGADDRQTSPTVQQQQKAVLDEMWAKMPPQYQEAFNQMSAEIEKAKAAGDYQRAIELQQQAKQALMQVGVELGLVTMEVPESAPAQ